MLNNGLHIPREKYVKYQKPTVCVAKIRLKNGENITYLRENDAGGNHVEEYLIRYLNLDFCKNDIKTVNVFLNRSPCPACTAKLLGLNDRLPAGAITIRFTVLHRLLRQSCCSTGCNCFRLLDKTRQKSAGAEASRNGDDLWKLGDSIQSFSRYDWKELSEALSALEIYWNRLPGDLAHRLRHDPYYKELMYFRDKEDEVLSRDCRILRREWKQKIMTSFQDYSDST